MPQQRDPRYRGRRQRAVPPQRKPGHLCTTYAEDDFDRFEQDLKRLRSVWPDGVIEGDRKAARRDEVKSTAIICAVFMAIVSAIIVWGVVDIGAPWWWVPVGQSVCLLILVFRMIITKDSDYTAFYIYREADRRGIRYVKGETPFYALMNRLNADYNSHLWNRHFTWT